jgi:hypothetical protein
MAVERVELKGVMESRGNLYHVPVRQWRKWPAKCRQVFNEVYSTMSRNQDTFLHPQQDKISKRMWKTTAWNAAWIAADAAK